MESYERESKSSMANIIENEGGSKSSMANIIAVNGAGSKSSTVNGGIKNSMAETRGNEEGSKSFNADSIHNEGGTKSFIADSFENGGGSKSFMADSIANGGGSESSMVNEEGRKSFMADSIENEEGSKSFMADSIENEGGSESSIADSPAKKSCSICLSWGTCRYHLAEPNKQLSVYSSACDDVGKQKQQLYTEGRQMGTTTKRVDEKQDSTPEQSILGSSVWYGGPEEYYDSLNRRNKETDKIKTEVRELEEAADPFNLEYTIRGNWWKGEVLWITKHMEGLKSIFFNTFQAMLESVMGWI